MRKPELLRRIYAELRDGLPEEISSGDVLKIANQILRSYQSPKDLLQEFGQVVDQRGFFALSIDEAMSDGGWAVADFERRRDPGWVDSEYEIEDLDREQRIKRYLGESWSQVNWRGNDISIRENDSEK